MGAQPPGLFQWRYSRRICFPSNVLRPYVDGMSPCFKCNEIKARQWDPSSKSLYEKQWLMCGQFGALSSCWGEALGAYRAIRCVWQAPYSWFKQWNQVQEIITRLQDLFWEPMLNAWAIWCLVAAEVSLCASTERPGASDKRRIPDLSQTEIHGTEFKLD